MAEQLITINVEGEGLAARNLTPQQRTWGGKAGPLAYALIKPELQAEFGIGQLRPADATYLLPPNAELQPGRSYVYRVFAPIGVWGWIFRILDRARMIFGFGPPAGSTNAHANIIDIMSATYTAIDEIKQMMISDKAQLRINPSTARSSTAMMLLDRWNIQLDTTATLPDCCNLPLSEGRTIPRFNSSGSEKHLMEPARQYMQSQLVPEGVLVLKVDSRESLDVSDAGTKVRIYGKTDFLLVEQSTAHRLLGPDLDEEKKPTEEDVTSLLKYAVLALVELKTANCTAGNAYKFWPQAVIEAVSVKHVTGKLLPVFAGDLNHMVLVHWSTAEQQPAGQPTLHIGASLEAGAMHGAMRVLLERQLAAFSPSGDVPQQQQQQPDQQSPGGRRRSQRLAGFSTATGSQAVHAPASLAGTSRSAQRGSAARDAYRHHGDWCPTASDVVPQSPQEVYEAIIADVAEAIEYDPDVDMSALDQAKESKFDTHSRIVHTLKYVLPRALAEQCAQQGGF